MNIREPIIIHPFLFAVFPVLFLFAHNIKELQIFVVFIPMMFVLILTAVMFISFKRIFKNDQKVAVLLSLAVVLFFSYGPFSYLVRDIRLPVGPVVIGSHKIYLITAGILFFWGAYCLIRTRKNLNNLTKIMNVASLSLILIPLITIIVHELPYRGAGRDDGGRINSKANEILLGETAKRPNIYYIILDAYGRQDILSQIYGYDNAEFIKYLKQRGFYIADQSKSNYHGTYLSLASSLNLSYLDPIDDEEKRFSNNKVFSLMKRNGYTTVFISSLDKDIRMSKADFNLRRMSINDFDYLLMNHTPIPELMGVLQISLDSYGQHRDRINYAFDTIADTTEWGSPIFVYAHIFSPHPPFVFGPNGESIQPGRKYSVNDAIDFFSEGGTREEYIKGYREQVQYINKRLTKLIDHILSRKDDSSVIILQADHGPRSMIDWSNLDKTYLAEAYAIFNAYYLPSHGEKVLYESITPVNTFRLVFNLYFGESFDLLEDRSYYRNIRVSPAIVDVTTRADISESRFLERSSDSFRHPP